MSALTTALKKALEADPANWETRLSLTEAYLQEGLEDEVVALFDGVEMPSDEGGILAASRCYALMGSPHAREILDSLLQEDAENPRAQLALSFIAHSEGDADAAARHFATATSLDSSLADRDAVLAEAYGSSPSSAPAPDAAPIQVTDADAVAEPAVEETVIPGPGEFPVEPVEVAVATNRIRPLVDPKSVPDAAKLVVEEPIGATAKVNLPEPEIIAPIIDETAGEHTGHILVAAAETEDGVHIASPDESIRAHKEEADLIHRKSLRRDKLQSLFVTAAVHVGVIIALGVIVINTPRLEPPQIVAVASPTQAIDTLEKKKVLLPTQATNTKPPSAMVNVISSNAVSSFAIPTMKNQPMPDQAVFGVAFTPSLDFTPAGQEGMPTLFGEKIDGKTLGVILDVSGSMSEYLPKVIREIDRNFEKASIIFVNNMILRDGLEASSEIRPILTDDVKPRNEDGFHTPYWFLWYDLPRKAEQAAVDRLIKIFKERPNCYLAVGGNNRIASSMDHLRSLGVDAIYMFSDYEDYTDEEVTVESSRELSKADIKVYVQPVQERSEFLEIITRKLAARTGGRELKSLIKALDLEPEPQPLLADVMDPEPVEVKGVNYSTARPERYGKEFYDYKGPGKTFQTIEVYERENFDLVLYGPSARAEIFLKTKDGYIGRPISFRYYSRKWRLDERGDWRWRQRKWLRNSEEPELDGNEIKWKMVLEDEQEFEIWFKFEDNTFMATYAATLVPHEKGDHTSIGFYIPPQATEKKDIYYAADFPQGRNLDKLREAAVPNNTVFNLSSKERDRYATQWKIYGWEPGINIRTHDVLIKRLPNGLRDARVSGQSYGDRILTVATRQNDILLHASNYRSDIELWQGYSFHITRPAGRERHRLTKTEAFQLTVE